MGSILGFFTGLGLISSAWSGDLTFWGIGLFVVLALLGTFVFSITVGTFSTAVMFMSQLAVIAGLIYGTSSSALAALGIGIGAAVTQFLVGRVRPEAAY